jgi:hypothetical protein
VSVSTSLRYTNASRTVNDDSPVGYDDIHGLPRQLPILASMVSTRNPRLLASTSPQGNHSDNGFTVDVDRESGGRFGDVD